MANIFIAGRSQVQDEIRIILPKKKVEKSTFQSNEVEKITKNLSLINQQIKEINKQKIEPVLTITILTLFVSIFISLAIGFYFTKKDSTDAKDIINKESQSIKKKQSKHHSLSKEIKTDTTELRKSLDRVGDTVFKISNEALTDKELADLQRDFEKYKDIVESYLQKLEDENNFDEKLDDLKFIST